jgi:mRNA deadenylase 3'-5' endonuclease subunit Ccr4
MSIKFLHWNVLADKLANSFPKVPKDFLRWEYRFELMKQHIRSVDPDVIGLSEVDVMPLYRQLQEFMSSQGYADFFVEKSNGISGSAIFYKKEKFVCLQQKEIQFGEGSSQFFMYCLFARRTEGGKGVPSSGTSAIHDPKQQFVFGETHLKAKEKFQEERIR